MFKRLLGSARREHHNAANLGEFLISVFRFAQLPQGSFFIKAMPPQGVISLSVKPIPKSMITPVRNHTPAATEVECINAIISLCIFDRTPIAPQ